MEIKRVIINFGTFRGVYKLVYDNGYYWGWLSDYWDCQVLELEIDEHRTNVNRYKVDERFQFKPEDLLGEE